MNTVEARNGAAYALYVAAAAGSIAATNALTGERKSLSLNVLPEVISPTRK
jgi:hypothetical protein